MSSDKIQTSRSSYGPVTVLLVEDEPNARDACEIYLTWCGYDVRVAADVEEALQQAARTIPQIAVCDWRLANGDSGIDAAKELQRLYGTLVIFVTALPLDELRAASEDVEVLEYLRKPISLPQLARSISHSVN